MGERHHRSWVGPPEYYDRIGALQFIVLVLLGMREHHSLLDIGCGSLRGGRLSLMYLNECRYFGLEPERWVLEAGIAHEVSEGLIALKKPRFAHTSDFSAKHFGVEFDFIIANGMFMHTGLSQIKQCLESAAEVLAPEGLFVGAYLQGDADSAHDTWTYPGIQRYTPERLAHLARSAGLRIHFVDWPHTFDHQWFLAVHERSTRQVSACLDLSVFSWSEYLADQIVACGGTRRTHVDYLKEELGRRVGPEQEARVVPQALPRTG
jgi:SAM-dependent methyltransferase